MADIFVQSPVRYPPLKDLSEIDLQGAEQKGKEADKKEHRTRHPDALEEKRGRQDHVGQEKAGGPAGGGMLPQEVEKGTEDRIKEEGEGTDHDHHFQGHDKKHHDAAESSQPLCQKSQPFHTLASRLPESFIKD